MSDELFDLVGLDADDHEAQEAIADAQSVSDLITTLVWMRCAAGLSQKVVAERMGTTQSAVSELERVATDPHVSTLQRFSRAVGAKLNLIATLDGGWTQLGHKRISAGTQVDDLETDESSGVDAPWQSFAQGKTAIRIVG